MNLLKSLIKIVLIAEGAEILLPKLLDSGLFEGSQPA